MGALWVGMEQQVQAVGGAWLVNGEVGDLSAGETREKQGREEGERSFDHLSGAGGPPAPATATATPPPPSSAVFV